MGKYAKMDIELVRTDIDGRAFVFSDASTGNPIDISTWTFSFKANEIDQSGTPDTISIPDSAMTKSNSGLGTTDRLDIPFSISDTTVNEGRYRYDVQATTAAGPETIFRGTLTIIPSEQD